MILTGTFRTKIGLAEMLKGCADRLKLASIPEIYKNAMEA